MAGMNDFAFELEMQVRDYECDLQGIVNNAVYQHYLEHCRHKFLLAAGLDFVQMHNEGVDGVVIKAEIEYKFPLKPGDDFYVRLKPARQGRLRIIFIQEIVCKADEKLILKAQITTALTKNGRPFPSDLFVKKLEDSGIVINELTPS
jgi:acyl-CoA thioester hydrolase